MRMIPPSDKESFATFVVRGWRRFIDSLDIHFALIQLEGSVWGTVILVGSTGFHTEDLHTGW